MEYGFIRHLIFLLGFTFFLASPIKLMAQEVSFEAVTDVKQILESNYMEVSFVITNGRGRYFKPPSFSGFKILRGPVTNYSMQNINGVSSTQMAYAYVLQPERTGILTIGPASVQVNQQLYKTKSLRVTVIKDDAANSQNVNSDLPAVFFKAELSSSEAYVGQQVFLDYKLYVRSGLNKERQRIVTEPSYQGFFQEPVNWYKVYQEVLDGQQYTSWIIKRVALFPQTSGTQKIGVAQVNVDIADQTRTLGLFGYPTERLSLRSDPVDLVVKPLPSGAPASFSGAVGNYEVSATFDKSQLTTDDALKVQVRMVGNGDDKQVRAVDLELPIDTFDLYPPKTMREQKVDREGQFRHVKEFEYALTPKVPGNYRIEVPFTHFAPDSAKYVTKIMTHQLLVRPGVQSNNNKPTIATSREEESFLPQITSTRLRDRTPSFQAGPLFWALSILPFIGVGVVAGVQRRNQQLANRDPSELRRSKADQIALERLQKAQVFMTNNDQRGYFDELSKALMGYMQDKMGLEQAKMSKAKIQETLLQKGVLPDIAQRFVQLLRDSEMALFAGVDQTQKMASTYEEARNLIRQVEEA
ncbi:MAG: BatD family protein [Bacteroidota bacterium]